VILLPTKQRASLFNKMNFLQRKDALAFVEEFGEKDKLISVLVEPFGNDWVLRGVFEGSWRNEGHLKDDLEDGLALVVHLELLLNEIYAGQRNIYVFVFIEHLLFKLQQLFTRLMSYLFSLSLILLELIFFCLK
jgi:hypothetical protein